MLTKDISGTDVLNEARKARAGRGGGVNESIPMTPRVPYSITKTQMKRDGLIAKELVYLNDVANRPDLLLAAFWEHRNRLSPQRYWEFLKLIWIRCGTIERIPLFRQLFSAKKTHKYWIMSPEEEAALKAMPNEFTVWRAPRPGGDDGISWSVERAFVAQYAEANGRDIIERTVKKKDVFAYFDRAGEGEVIIL